MLAKTIAGTLTLFFLVLPLGADVTTPNKASEVPLGLGVALGPEVGFNLDLDYNFAEVELTVIPRATWSARADLTVALFPLLGLGVGAVWSQGRFNSFEFLIPPVVGMMIADYLVANVGVGLVIRPQGPATSCFPLRLGLRLPLVNGKDWYGNFTLKATWETTAENLKAGVLVLGVHLGAMKFNS